MCWLDALWARHASPRSGRGGPALLEPSLGSGAGFCGGDVDGLPGGASVVLQGGLETEAHRAG